MLSRIPDRIVLGGLCMVFAVQALLGVAGKSATFDEPANLVSGYLELTRGQYWLKPEVPPFPKWIAAIPLLWLHVRTPPPDADRWALYDRTLYQLNDANRLLMAGRTALLPFSLVLGALVFVWTRRLFGGGAARLALLLYAFEPNLLAHAPLITTDVEVACLFFLTVWGLFRLVEEFSISRVGLVAFGLALALVTKLSTLVLVPLIALIGLVVSALPWTIPVTFRGVRVGTLAGRGRKLAAVALVLLVASAAAYVTIWASYRFDYSAASSPAHPPDCPALRPTGVVDHPALDWLRRGRWLPEPYLHNVFEHLDLGRFIPGYLLGEVRPGGWWYYFVVTLLVKTPVPLLILIGLALGVHARHWRRAPRVTVFLLLPAGVYFAAISASGINIGHRHLLPALPFLVALTGILVPWAGARGRWVKGGLALLVLWHLASSLAAFPHYLAYFNEAVGGSARGSRYLADSNLDWGQDLPALGRYMERHGIDRVWLSYFGTADPDYHGIRHDRLPGVALSGREPLRGEFMAVERLPRLRGPVAISVTNLRGVYLPCVGVGREYFAAYRDARPLARIGYSIYLYRFD